jgi:hypothetical protein
LSIRPACLRRQAKTERDRHGLEDHDPVPEPRTTSHSRSGKPEQGGLSAMLRFVGCDVHKRTAVFTILLEDGTLFASYTVPVTREALRAFAERQLSRADRLAIEATTNTWAVAGVLRPFVQELVISNPLKVRAIAEAKIKTDKVDSRVLAACIRFCTTVWSLCRSATCSARKESRGCGKWRWPRKKRRRATAICAWNRPSWKSRSSSNTWCGKLGSMKRCG